MEGRPPFPETETGICELLSCESMEGMETIAPHRPPIKNHDMSDRPFVMMPPPSAGPSCSSYYTLQPSFITCSSPLQEHTQSSLSSVLIPNTNPNSIARPSPDPFNPVHRWRYLAPSNIYPQDQTYEKAVCTCRYKKAPDRDPPAAIEDDQVEETFRLGQAGNDEGPSMMSASRFGLLAADACSPWMMSWADEQYDDDNIVQAGVAPEKYIPTTGIYSGRHQPPAVDDGADSPIRFCDPPCPRSDSPIVADRLTALPSPSPSSAGELHQMLIDDSANGCRNPTMPSTPTAPHEVIDEDGLAGATHAAVPTDDIQPLLENHTRGGQG